MMSEEGNSLFGRLILTVIVLVLSPFVEIVTLAAPIGTVGAVVALAAIWGLDLEGTGLESESDNE